MRKSDEAIAIRLIALIDYRKNFRELLGNIGEINTEIDSLGKILFRNSRRYDDKRLRVIADHFIEGKSYSECSRAYAYSRDGIKQIIRFYRNKSKKMYPNLYPSEPL